MDDGDKVAREDQHEHADKERGDVDEQNEEQIKFHRCLADIIGLGIKTHDTCSHLKNDDTDAKDVAQKQTAPDNEHGEPKERVTNHAVAGTQGFEDTNHLSALKDDDKEAANHREACEKNHQA